MIFTFENEYWSYTPGLFDQYYYCKLLPVLLEKCEEYTGKSRGKVFPSRKLSCVYMVDTSEAYKLDAKSQIFKYSDLPIYSMDEAPQALKSIMEVIKKKYCIAPRYILCHVYRNGLDKVGWHSDHESDLDIISVSLSADNVLRKFKFRHKHTKKVTDIMLACGDTIHMYGPSADGTRESCQKVYEHSVPVMKRVEDYRINLTFRMFDN